MNTPDNTEIIRRIAERLVQLEKRMEVLEKTLSNTEKSDEIAHSRETKIESKEKESPLISIELVKKNYHKATYTAVDSGDRIDFVFRFTNHLMKDIRAFTGAVFFRDLFERNILRVDLTNEQMVQPKGSIDWRGGIEFNQFDSDHQRLLTVDQKDLSVDFVVQHIIFADGSRQSFGE